MSHPEDFRVTHFLCINLDEAMLGFLNNLNLLNPSPISYNPNNALPI